MNIGVIGLGKLGLPMCAVFASKGHNVVGVDKLQQAVDRANQFQPSVPEPAVIPLLATFSESISFTTKFDALEECEIVFVIVPTPTDPATGMFTNAYVIDALAELGRVIGATNREYNVVIVSTVMPQSCDEVLYPFLLQTVAGDCSERVQLCYNPEFIALGDVVNGMLHPDILLIGESSPDAGAQLQDFWKTICPERPVHRMSLQQAELTKLSLNVALCTKITYGNFIGRLASSLGIKHQEVLQAVGGDSRIGIKYLKAGAPIGGPCLPRDTLALQQYMLAHHISENLLDAIITEDRAFSDNIVSLACLHTPPGGSVGILGWSYKPGTCLVEASGAFRLAEQLIEKEREVHAHDPQAQVEMADVLVHETAQECIDACHTVIVHTPWGEYRDLNTELFKDKLVIDFWGMLKC